MTLFDFIGGSKEDSLSLVKKTKTKPKTAKQNTLDETIRKVEMALGDYKDNYQYITTEEELHNLINAVVNDGLCSIDTETTGLNMYREDIVGISIYSNSIKATYIPINHISLYTKEKVANQLSEDIIHKEFSRLKDTKIIWHNYHFDYKVFKLKLNLDLPIYWDTLVGAHLLNENEEHGLKYLYKKYVENSEEGVFKFSSLFEGMKFNSVPIKVGFIYASHDAYMTYKLYEYQLNEFKKKDNETIYRCFKEIEIPILKPTLDMELRGIELDTHYAESLAEEYNKKLGEARQLYYNELKKYQKDIDKYRSLNPDKLDDPVNYASPSQMAILFYDIIKVKPVSEKTPRGTGEAILKEINLPICDRILECRGYEKLIGTYIEKLPKTIEYDNAIHTSFNTCGTVTGRFSSSDPKLNWALM